MSSPPDLTTLATAKQWLGIGGTPIVSVTLANPAVVTISGQPTPPLISGMTLSISGTGIIDGDQVATMLSANTFSVPVDTTLSPPYVYGGVVSIADSLVARLITASSLSILNLITRDIFATSYTETRNGLGGNVMMTEQYPITAVAGVTVNGVALSLRAPLTNSSTTTSGYGTYTFDRTRIYAQSCYGFPMGQQNVVLQYTAGYATVPADLEQACLDILADWFTYRNRTGKMSESIEGQSISFLTTQMKPMRAMGIIQTYNSVAPVY